MKKVKRVICVLVMVLFAAGFPAWAAGSAAAGTPQEKCPVMDGKIDKASYADYQGKRIYFCCPACPDEFKKDPAKYMKKLTDQGVVLESSPKSD